MTSSVLVWRVILHAGSRKVTCTVEAVSAEMAAKTARIVAQGRGILPRPCDVHSHLVEVTDAPAAGILCVFTDARYCDPDTALSLPRPQVKARTLSWMHAVKPGRKRLASSVRLTRRACIAWHKKPDT